MTDYAKHIEVLERNINEWSDGERVAATRAAIELMRAAMPKDAEAEREHCLAVAYEWAKPLSLDSIPFELIRPTNLILRERAAARAEGDTVGYTRACLTRVAEVEAELSAAQAESAERLRVALACGRELAAAKVKAAQAEGEYQRLLKSHAAAKAQIERLHDAWEHDLKLADVETLETKLTNLRAAANAAVDAWNLWTSQEMYGEHIRESMVASDFEAWESSIDGLRAALKGTL